MTKDFICIKCDMVFPTEEAYKVHKQATHNNPQVAELPPGVTPEMLPDPEFIKRVQEVEGKKLHDNPVVVPNTFVPRVAQPQIVSISVPPSPPKPIELTYKFEGTCPEHTSVTVDTLLLDVARQQFAIAYCPICKTNKKQIKVVPLAFVEKSIPQSIVEPKKPIVEKEKKK